MSWVCVDRAARIAPLFGAADARRRWLKVSRQIRDEVLERGCSSNGRHLVSFYGADEVDSSLLLMPGLRFLPHEHPLVTGTVDEIQRRLSDRGFIRRYEWDDGVAGEEGAFIICGFWLAEALAMVGRVDEAQDVFARHAAIANHAGLLSEEVDPTTREPLGNFPQAFSHLGLISAACRIDLALRLRDEGAAQTPLFTLER
jgi:GH15 family glucan-1,4-alpha-glucosidase